VDIKTNVSKGSWAAQNMSAGRMWPAGRGLRITDLAFSWLALMSHTFLLRLSVSVACNFRVSK